MRYPAGFLIVLGSIALPIFKVHSAQLSCSAEVIQARQYFKRENELLQQRRHKEYVAVYEYNTNVTEENRKRMIQIGSENAIKNKELAEHIKKSNYVDIDDEEIKRQVAKLTDIGEDVLNRSDYLQLKNAVSAMQTNYATTTVCSFTNQSDCTLTLEPHIQERISNSRNPEELAWYWKQWYDKAGTPMRDNFAKYVELTRKAANLNNYSSNADYWIHFYEDPEFEKNLDASYKAILPLYQQLHGFVRYRLREKYGDAVVPAEGNIPMHLLGNLWGQQWDNIIEIITPYPELPYINVTGEMKRQDYTVPKMFELGDDFFQSLGMRALPSSFWNLSVLTRPTNREVVCHASAWDLYKDSDVRIKMCTEIDAHYLYVVHHELGHIQYYLQYEQQPAVFRGAPNPGFHEAVGDVIALSVSSVKHLKSIGLSKVDHLDEQSRINKLFLTALTKVVVLPFVYTIDKYRYAVFRDEIKPSNWNSGFWKMRSEFSGIEPPVKRTDEDFDPPAKYHINADIEYFRYFAAHIFQFQFLKHLCRAAGQYNDNDLIRSLDNCDYYGSKEAGNDFLKFLSAGDSQHWKKTLKEFTGDTEMNSDALLEYFSPLYEWLKQENARLNVPLGWTLTDKVPTNI